MKHTIGVIGTGEIAQLHMEAIIPLGWELAGGYDIVPGAARAFCETWGGRVYESAQALLSDPAIDTVYICTRHDSHVELCTAALTAEKNVFLEKPVAITMQEARRLLAVHRAHPAHVAVGHNMRAAPATRRFCELLQTHAAQVASFRASMTGPAFMDGWASDPVQGGGVLVCQGTHMFDLLRHTLGSPVAAVCGTTQHLGLSLEREANAATLLVRLESGACGTLLLHDRGTASFHAESEGRMVSITAYAPQGTFEMDAYGKVRWGTALGFSEELPSRDRNQCVSWGYAAQAAEFGRLLDTGFSYLCTLEQGVENAEAVEAARASAMNMQWTPVVRANERKADEQI